ncbi:MAG: amidohydrolase family protein, partial [Longimicrobiales bacterium]
NEDRLRRRRIVRQILFIALAAAALGPVAGSGQERAVAFVNVNVVPLDREHVLPDQTVIVQGGRITALGAATRTSVPAGALRVDGRGKFLMPGLTEMHGHITGPGSGYSPENVLFLYIAGGATTVRGMQGQPSHLALRQRVESGELIGPRLYLSSPPLSGNNTPDVATAEQRVREAKQAGYDHLKVHDRLTKEVYDAIVRTAREVGLPWGGHVSEFVGVRGSLAAKQSTIDHIDDYVDAIERDEAKIPAIVRETRDAGVAIVPTMPLWEVLRGLHSPESMNDRLELKYAPAQTRAGWANQARTAQTSNAGGAGRREIELRNKILKAMSDAGVLILMGSDAPQAYSVPGFSLQREMESMAATGMTPFQVLQSGTINVAKYYRLEGEAGTVATGKRADLLLLDGNPLADLRNVARKAGVMVRGRWLPWSEIQQKLDEIEAAYR